MVRIIGGLIGLGFAFVLMLALWGTLTTPATPPTAEAKYHLHPRDAELASAGAFGHFDVRQVQRGFQVYKEVCSACHSIHLVSFRDLSKLGYTPAEVKKIAADWQIEQPSVNPDTGEPATRKNLPSDHFPLVFANDVAARAANNNAVPPDLSLMAKARHEGPDYIYSLITGYRNQPAELANNPATKTPAGLHYNPYFANLNLAMPPPLRSDGQVQYLDGTRPTVDQMARDVAAFLTWTAEPNLEARHAAGLATVVFLLFFCFLAYGAYLSVWRGVKH